MISSSKYGMKIVRKNFSTSMFSHLKPRPADPILGIVEEFKKDKDANKVNLSAGTYKDNDGKPYILNCVRAAEKLILDKKIDHEYLPIEGLQGFIKNSLKVAYAEDNLALKENRIVGIQGLSGTGSLRLGFEFFSTSYTGNKTVFIPNPSWPNHKNIVARSGMEFKEYRYYDSQNKSLNLNGMLEDLDKAPEKSIVILHVCAHNPTGMDPTQSQWEDIYKVIAKKNHLPFFDMAYQGFASGDCDADAFAVRHFVA
jgi:aspartate aminotransferase